MTCHSAAATRLVVLLLLATGLAGCESRDSLPSSPSQLPGPAATSGPAAPAPTPQPTPTGIQPAVTAITPDRGSTTGGAWGTIMGTGFETGATVTFGSTPMRIWVREPTSILFSTSLPHAAGTVDVIVINPGGRASTLPGGYTYAPAESFDFNEDWIAHAGPDYETDMRFTIRNNVLVSLSCGTSATLTPSTPPSIRNGEFSFLSEDGLSISGRLVSPVNAVGMINAPGCTDARWWADRGEVSRAGFSPDEWRPSD